jgi:ABC-type nitrate/sulfonate/bicarbonate transport system permease component
VALGTGTTLLLLVVIEMFARAGAIEPEVLPAPSRIASGLVGMLDDREFWSQLGKTLSAWAIGLLASIVIAVPFGLLIGALPWLFEWVHAVIEFLRPIPPVALIPLAVLIYGPTTDMKIFLIVAASIWPLLFQTLYGIRDVDRVLDETSRAFRLGWWLRVRYVFLPSTLPYLVTGLRISATIALIVTIASELVSGAPGLGSGIRFAQFAAATVDAWALILTVGALGLAINAAFRAAERKLLHWHPSQQLGEAA